MPCHSHQRRRCLSHSSHASRGGHTPFAGANNTDNGVTIDLSGLVSVNLKKDDTELQVGGGAKWGNVYPVLEPKNLTVIGGRSSAVGVGGLVTGGGISQFSGRYGWACDNVNNYQVVFADGIIRDVNQRTHPDVFKALRGGGNNFGIVTRFDFATYPQGKMWGGMARYQGDGPLVPLVNALESYNIRHPEDPDCAVIVSYMFRKIWLMVVIMENAKPVANPALLKNFTDVPATLGNTARITNLPDLTDELAEGQPAGDRQSFWTFTIHNSAELMLELSALFAEDVAKLASIADLLAALNFQVISKATTSHFGKNGGNSLGMTAADGPLILINVATTWTNAADDVLMYATIASFMARGKAAASAKSMLHPYVYLNYADASADVFGSYGAASKAELLATHKKWDAFNVFTQLQPGGHKLK